MSVGLFKKKADPISERSRALEQEIAALESKIKKLSTKVEQPPARPRVRSTATPSVSRLPVTPPVVVEPEPLFEDVDQNRVKQSAEPLVSRQHYNDLGVRKFDLPALWRKILTYFGGKPVSNPKLVTYLAAGSIQGLQPLRYEKRVARNRFIFFSIILLVILWGVFSFFLRNR